MAGPWIDQKGIQESLAEFFDVNRKEVSLFGNTVNQTFEAFVFASVISWYKTRGWKINFVNPHEEIQGDGSRKQTVRLKFSTRGRPENYTYVTCEKGDQKVDVRHQLRVATRFHLDGGEPPANICLDVAVIKSADLSDFTTDMHVPNGHLVAFGEAKHMSAFAELVAGFLGLVHEMQPERLKRVRVGLKKQRNTDHPAAFLYVSGVLYRTAEGIVDTIQRRKYDVDVYTATAGLSDTVKIPVRQTIRS